MQNPPSSSSFIPHPSSLIPSMVVSPKKLIEVALPLDAINAAAAREKSIRHGHPSTLASLVGAAAAGGGAGGDLRAARSRSRRPLAVPEPGVSRTSRYGALDEGAAAAVQDHRRPGAVGEHDQRSGAGAGAGGDPAELAGDLRAQQGSPAGDGTLRPGQNARPSRSIRRRRVDPARGAAARPGGLSPAT